MFTEELQAVASIGTGGDSYDNAQADQAESLIGLYKTECTRTKDPGAASTTSSSPP